MTFTQSQVSKLQAFLKERRFNRMKEVLKFRTDHLTLALEDIYQPHNASAVVRTCEALGIQNLHIIQKQNPYQINKDIVLGSAKWISLHKYGPAPEATSAALEQLGRKGYRIVACSPHIKGKTPEELEIEHGPIALFIGTEKHGLSQEVFEAAHEFLEIPMLGFTESFNLSVFAALCLYTLRQRMNKNWDQFKLSEEREQELLSQWLRLEIPDWEWILKNPSELKPSH